MGPQNRFGPTVALADHVIHECPLDPDLKILETCSQVVVHIVRQLADSLILPFDVMEYVQALNQALDHVTGMLTIQLPAIPGNRDCL